METELCMQFEEINKTLQSEYGEDLGKESIYQKHIVELEKELVVIGLGEPNLRVSQSQQSPSIDLNKQAEDFKVPQFQEDYFQ